MRGDRARRAEALRLSKLGSRVALPAGFANDRFDLLLEPRRIAGDTGVDDQVEFFYVAAGRQRQFRFILTANQVGHAEEAFP